MKSPTPGLICCQLLRDLVIILYGSLPTVMFKSFCLEYLTYHIRALVIIMTAAFGIFTFNLFNIFVLGCTVDAFGLFMFATMPIVLYSSTFNTLYHVICMMLILSFTTHFLEILIGNIAILSNYI